MEFNKKNNNHGDWGLGIGDWAQSPIPNPQIPNPQSPIKFFEYNINFFYFYYIYYFYLKILNIFIYFYLVIYYLSLYGSFNMEIKGFN